MQTEGIRNAEQPVIVMADIVLAQTCLVHIILQFWELNIQTLKKFYLYIQVSTQYRNLTQHSQSNIG